VKNQIHDKQSSVIGVVRGACPQRLVILCFKMWHPKQNSVIRLKANIIDPHNFRHAKTFERATPLLSVYANVGFMS